MKFWKILMLVSPYLYVCMQEPENCWKGINTISFWTVSLKVWKSHLRQCKFLKHIEGYNFLWFGKAIRILRLPNIFYFVRKRCYKASHSYSGDSCFEFLQGLWLFWLGFPQCLQASSATFKCDTTKSLPILWICGTPTFFKFEYRFLECSLVEVKRSFGGEWALLLSSGSKNERPYWLIVALSARSSTLKWMQCVPSKHPIMPTILHFQKILFLDTAVGIWDHFISLADKQLLNFI
jgi:hypothetical protein